MSKITLCKWLQLRSNGSDPLSDRDIILLWKGLFLYMQKLDNPYIQEKTADNLASLLHCFDQKDASIGFYGAFLEVMGKQWFRVEQMQINRFVMLVRRVTRQCFVILHTNEWNEKLIEQLKEYIEKSILDRSTPIVFLMHFTEIFLDELANVTAGTVSKSKVNLLIVPFVIIIATQRHYKIVGHTIKHIFNALLYQSDVGRAYAEKFEAWKRKGFPGTMINDLELEADERYLDEEQSNSVSSVPDTRVAHVDVVVPEIPFDPEDMIKKMEHLLHEPSIDVKFRCVLRKLIDNYSSISTGKVQESDLYQPTRDIIELNMKKRKEINEEVQPKKRKLSRVEHLKLKKQKFFDSWVETDLTPEEMSINVHHLCQKPFNENTFTDPDIYNEHNLPSQEKPEDSISKGLRIKDANAKWFKYDDIQSARIRNSIYIIDKLKSAFTPTCAPLSAATPTNSEKKVKIMLELNRSQENSEYMRQLQSEPKIPYDSAKKPGKGLLKPNWVPGPIDPCYRKNWIRV